MSTVVGDISAYGALIGFLVSSGVWLVLAGLRRMRGPALAERVAPYVADMAARSKLEEDTTQTPFGVLGRLLQPILADAATAVERFAGGTRSVRRRLVALGRSQTVEDFRIEQVIWGVVGAIAGIGGTVLLSILSESVNLIGALLLVITGIVSGVLARDWWLSVQVRKREAAMLAEFPVVAELLALAVTAGESPVAALERVTRSCKGELVREIERSLAEARLGASLPTALQALAERSTLEVLVRFVDGLIIALERGTPLAEVLRAQAADVRHAGKRALMASAGRRELAMMVPVVFLILPVTVLFALYPGLISITVLTR